MYALLGQNPSTTGTTGSLREPLSTPLTAGDQDPHTRVKPSWWHLKLPTLEVYLKGVKPESEVLQYDGALFLPSGRKIMTTLQEVRLEH